MLPVNGYIQTNRTDLVVYRYIGVNVDRCSWEKYKTTHFKTRTPNFKKRGEIEYSYHVLKIQVEAKSKHVGFRENHACSRHDFFPLTGLEIGVTG